MFVWQGRQLVEVGDNPFILGDRSVGDPFPQYWHRNTPLGNTGGPTLIVNGPVDFMDCPTRFNVNGGACDPVVEILDSTAATPNTYLKLGTLGELENAGGNAFRVRSLLGDLNLEHAAFGLVNVLNDLKVHNTATIDTSLVVNEDGAVLNPLRVENAGDTNFLLVNSAGTVGIGAGASPSAKLHVKALLTGGFYVDCDANDAIRFNSAAGANYFNLDNSVTPRRYEFKGVPPTRSNFLDMDETAIDMSSTWADFTVTPMLNMTKTIGAGALEFNGPPLRINETVNATAFALANYPIQVDLTNASANGQTRAVQVINNQSAGAQTEAIFAQNNSTVVAASNHYGANTECVSSSLNGHAYGYRGYGQCTDAAQTAANYTATGLFGFAATVGGGLGVGVEATVSLATPNASRIVAYYNNGHVHGTGGVWYCYAGTLIAAAAVTLNINPAVDQGSAWIEEKLEVVNGGVYIDLHGSHHGFNSADTVPAWWGFADDCSIRWDGTDMSLNSDNNVSGGLVKFTAASNWPAGGAVAPAAIPNTLPAAAAGTFGGWLSVKDNGGNVKYIPTWN